MDLFSFSETAPGMVFWHNDGLIIKNNLIDFWRKEHIKAGYLPTRLLARSIQKKVLAAPPQNSGASGARVAEELHSVHGWW